MKPNIILITADELIYNGLGCTGNPIVQTPNIDSLASNGTIFQEAHCVSPLCTPSRISMFTGLYTHAHNKFFVDEASHLGPEKRTLISDLKENGYKTALIGKNHTFKGSFLDRWFDVVEEYHHWGKQRGEMRPGDQEVYDWRHNDKREQFAKFAEAGGNTVLGEGLIDEPEPFPEEQCMTHRIAEDASDFIKENADTPFFMKYSFPDPHWPTVVCEPYYSMYDPDSIEELPGFKEIDWNTHPFKHFIQSQACGFDEYTEDERKKIVAIYYGMITFIDKAVGTLIDSLEENGILNNTLIMFTSDHGCFAGHYGLVGKTGAFYESLLRIPLIVSGPGIQQNRTSDAQISNIDFMPTILEYANVPSSCYQQGKSFAHLFETPQGSHRDAIFAEACTPDIAPPPFDIGEYQAINKVRTEEDGWQWFIDYTTKGRSSMIRKDGWKYCFNSGDMEELYDLKNDPIELTNLATDPTFSAKKDELKSQLLSWLLDETSRAGRELQKERPLPDEVYSLAP